MRLLLEAGAVINALDEHTKDTAAHYVTMSLSGSAPAPRPGLLGGHGGRAAGGVRGGKTVWCKGSEGWCDARGARDAVV